MKSLHWYVVVLISVTVALVASYDSLMSKQLVLDANSGHEIQISSDADHHGGSSSLELTRTERQIELACSLDNSGYQWPYCNLSFVLGAAAEGVDLSDFDELTVKTSVSGPTDELRVYLIAAIQSESTQMADSLRKYQEVEFTPQRFGNEVTIPLKLFKTSTWWLERYGTSMLDADIQLDNIVMLQLSSATNAQPGDYQITFEQVVISGKIISRSNLYLMIIAMWALAALALVAIQNRSTKKKLTASIQRTTQLKQLNEALELQSKTYQRASQRDPLTGVYNRSALRIQADRWLAQIEERGDRLSMVLFDIDYFKAINDNHGHAIGDSVLVQVAKYCNEHIRQQDMLVRWGGEEFAIFCPQTELQFAEMLANKIRLGMQQESWPNGLKVTASFGVSEYFSGEPFKDFINRADQALYFSKQHGRNMVSVTGLE